MRKISKGLVSFITAACMIASIYAPCAAADESGTDDVDYSKQENWVLWNYGEEKDADVFFITPTVDMGREGNSNADISLEKTKKRFEGALNQELMLFSDTANVYAPLYRQMTFTVGLSQGEEHDRAYDIAYGDIKNAFMYFTEKTDDRPIIIAGYSQGAELAIDLVEDVFENEDLQQRLVAVYACGWKLTDDDISGKSWVKPAQSETDTGVIITYSCEAESITGTQILGENEFSYSINPLNWKTDSTPAPKEQNPGAVFTDYNGEITSEIPELTGAYIDPVRGALKTPDIDNTAYPGGIFPDGVYHLYDYQFFFRALQQNIAKRTAAFIDNRRSEPVYSLSLEAVSDTEECHVGDIFEVRLTALNNGDTSLTNVKLYFEDTEVAAAPTLKAGDALEKTIKLRADVIDIGNGDINIYAAADELDEPIGTAIKVNVLPDENNSAADEPENDPPVTPADKTTGKTDNPKTSDQAEAAAILPTLLLTVVILKKRIGV